MGFELRSAGYFTGGILEYGGRWRDIRSAEIY